MAILVPTCCQEVPNLTPRSPKRAQLVAKIAENTPQETPTRHPKMQPKRNRVVRFYDELKINYEEEGFHHSSEELLSNYKNAFNLFESEFEI